MDMNSIVKSVQGQDEEKVGFSLKLPISLKEELQSFCEEKSISMNSLIVATLQSLLNDECGKELKSMKRLLLSYRESINKELGVITDAFDKNNASPEMDQEYDGLLNTLALINKTLGV